MEQLTLQQLFGVNSSQDRQVLIIAKPDFSLLTPSANNTAESLLVAVLLKALENYIGTLSDANNIKVTDTNGVAVTYDNSALYPLFLIFPWQSYIKERSSNLYITDTIIIEQDVPYAD